MLMPESQSSRSSRTAMGPINSRPRVGWTWEQKTPSPEITMTVLVIDRLAETNGLSCLGSGCPEGPGMSGGSLSCGGAWGTSVLARSWGAVGGAGFGVSDAATSATRGGESLLGVWLTCQPQPAPANPSPSTR